MFSFIFAVFDGYAEELKGSGERTLFSFFNFDLIVLNGLVKEGNGDVDDALALGGEIKVIHHQQLVLDIHDDVQIIRVTVGVVAAEFF